MSTRFLSFLLAAAAAANVAQGAQTVTVCSAGECLTGQSNITRLGAVLSSQSNSYLLLPGQYTSSVQPASLEQALVSATSTITFTTGFSNSTTATTPSLPLNVALQPGLLNYPSDLYTGDPSFIALPQSVNGSLSSTGLSRGSIILAANTVATIEATNNGPKTPWQDPFNLFLSNRRAALRPARPPPSVPWPELANARLASRARAVRAARKVSLVLSVRNVRLGAPTAMTESTALASVARQIYPRMHPKTAIAPMVCAEELAPPRRARARPDGRRAPITMALSAPLAPLVSSRRLTETAKSAVLAVHNARMARASAPNAIMDSFPAMGSIKSVSSLHLNAQAASFPIRRRRPDVRPAIPHVRRAMVLPPPTVSRALLAHSSTMVAVLPSRLLQARESALEATWSPTHSRVSSQPVDFFPSQMHCLLARQGFDWRQMRGFLPSRIFCFGRCLHNLQLELQDLHGQGRLFNRCVKTCAKSEYLDSASGSCKTCDSSCASCSGGGASSCLSCNSNKQVLRAGKCVDVNCGSNSGPTSGLGVCLAELVQVPNNPTTPTIPPLDPNAQQPSSGGGHKLTWWQILLIVLGALLLLILLLLLWRRRARQKRAQETEQFKRNLKKQGLWSKLWRNPFAAWWARRRSAALARRSQDVERMSDAKDWKSNSSSADRRTAVGVPKSISRGSWVTMGQHTQRRGSFEGRSYMSGPNFAGLGAIHENRRYGDDAWERAHSTSGRSYERSISDGQSRRYKDEPRGESRYWGQEIEQEDVRSERTYDPYQYPRPDSRGSRDREDLVSIIKSEYTEGDRYDDRHYNHQRSHTRDDRSYRGDYPQSVSTRQTQSRHYRRDEPRSYGRGGETPSVYSQSTGHPPLRQMQMRMPMPPISFHHEEPPRDAVLSSRFSMSTTAASMHPPSKIQRKSPPAEPVPELKEPPRQLTDAEMYKMSKLFPELLKLVSPTKKEHSPPAAHTSPNRNPFRI
ncbi:SubName: Full=Uncharacterized protein {ECO:0000313/EMBL:CCA70636.1} [Serendipita indica DSM 11827]|nr:SubName: Full=Uncharacterized protein {ECO:0000313/EMBL:CCA70636.1} [Serendipita indica DSM 11827]